MKIYLRILFVKWLEINNLAEDEVEANDTHFRVMRLKKSKNSVSHPSFRTSRLATFYFHLALGPPLMQDYISNARPKHGSHITMHRRCVTSNKNGGVAIRLGLRFLGGKCACFER